MNILIALVSFFTLALLAFLAKKAFRIAVCPPCVGVAGTWIWIVVGIFIGLLDQKEWILIAAMLMGASVTGLAFQLEKKLPFREHLAHKLPILWKTFFLPFGFLAAWSILARLWFLLAISLLSLLFLGIRFFRNPHPERVSDEKKIEKLTKELDNCC